MVTLRKSQFHILYCRNGFYINTINVDVKHSSNKFDRSYSKEWQSKKGRNAGKSSIPHFSAFRQQFENFQVLE